MVQPILCEDAADADARVFEQRTLLLVDDEESILTVLERLFTRGGYTVLTANSGQAGLALLERHHIGVIISDQRMPGMTGVEFLSEVKQLYPDVMRLILSGFADLKAVTAAINEGAIYRFLTKPCDDELLLRNIGEAFRHFEIKRENERLQRELQSSRQGLEDAFQDTELMMQAKAAFLATMSYELRSPLNAVIGMTELMRETRLDEKQQEFIEVIAGSGKHLLAFINDILDYSRAEAGKLTLESIDFDLRDAVDDTTKLFIMQARNKGLELVTHFDLQVSPIVRGDPTRLRQVLTNLVSNAIKFTEQGKVVLRVSQYEDIDDVIGLRFEVSDTGIGITPAAQEQIFDCFSQGESTTTHVYGSTGLGLSISRQLVEVMDGEIGLDSEPGQGSRFWFTIHLARVALLPVISPVTSGSRRVLVVEDGAVDQAVICGLLSTMGFKANVMASGKQALEALSRQDYDLVLMDCQMPVMDGYEVSRRIRGSEPAGTRIPIIALTANALSGDRERCLRAGMDDYVIKPVNLHVLQNVLNRWLPTEDGLEPSLVFVDTGSS